MNQAAPHVPDSVAGLVHLTHAAPAFSPNGPGGVSETLRRRRVIWYNVGCVSRKIISADSRKADRWQRTLPSARREIPVGPWRHVLSFPLRTIQLRIHTLPVIDNGKRPPVSVDDFFEDATEALPSFLSTTLLDEAIPAPVQPVHGEFLNCLN